MTHAVIHKLARIRVRCRQALDNDTRAEAQMDDDPMVRHWNDAERWLRGEAPPACGTA